MAADGRADVIDDYLAVELREALLNKCCYRLSVIKACRHGDKALAGIVKAVLSVLLHSLDYLLDDTIFGADLISGDEVAAVIHVEKRADAQHCAEEAGRLGYPAALDIEGKVGGEKPVMQAELVCLYPIMKLIDALALVTHIGECVHDKTVAGGCTERVNDVYLSVGVLCLEHLGCGAGGVDGAGNAG